MSPDRTFVVSPYVHEIVPSRVPHYLAHLEDPGERARLLTWHERGELSLVFDSLNLRLLALARSDVRWLGALKARAGTTRRGDAGAPPDAYERYVADELLLPVDEVYRRHNYRSVDIEINRHCNMRCVFCPVSVSPKPKGFMTDETYAITLERTREYGAPLIALNHYSEPTLDPRLVEKIATAAHYGLSVVLHTNLSLFDEAKIAALADVGNVERVIVNLPTVDRAEYERVTGSKLFDRVMRNLRLLHRYHVPTRLAVNAPRHAADARLQAVNDEFAEMFGATFLEPTDSRADALAREDYAPLVRHSGRLNGCAVSLWQINVSAEGEAFLCCQDYDQEYVLGNLRGCSLRALAESDRAVEWRRTTFGGDTPTTEFICSKCAWTRSASKDGEGLYVGSPAKAVFFDEAPPPRAALRSGSLSPAIVGR